MKIDELIEELEMTIKKSWNLPLTGGKCIVDVYQIDNIINEIKINLPVEIQKAKDIISKEQKIVEGARSAGETIIKKAENRAKNIIDDQEVVRIAKDKAKDIITFAQRKEKEIKQSAYEYVDNMLAGVEGSLKKYLANIKEIKNIVYERKLTEKNDIRNENKV